MKQLPSLLTLATASLALHPLSGAVMQDGYEWFNGGSGTLELVGADLVHTMAETSSSTFSVYFAPEGNPVTLENPGESLTITWVFTLSGVNVSNSSQNFRIGVLDTPAELRLEADGNPAGDDAAATKYSGYALFANMGQTLGRSTPFQLRERSGVGAQLSSSGLWATVGDAGGQDQTGYVDGVSYTLTATIARTAAGEAEVNYTIAGGSIGDSGSISVTYLDPTPQPFVYDTFAIRPSGATTTAATITTTSLTVEPNNLTGGGETWQGFALVDGAWADTGASHFGWLYVEFDPWIYSNSLQNWFYAAEGFSLTGGSGNWIYLVK